ncbi:hypothetical protein JTB14_001842 [Gonioctena quinquepunctata]|nr:hypothetical protein JTB14_001842 [Gonioctena quinquepunctata]
MFNFTPHEITSICFLSRDNLYYFPQVSQENAAKMCQEKSMNLVSIQDEAKNIAVYEFLKENGKEDGSSFWLGGTRKANENWKWQDGTKITFSNWAKGEPNGSKNQVFCLQAKMSDGNLFWNDQYCSKSFLFICEKLGASCSA